MNCKVKEDKEAPDISYSIALSNEGYLVWGTIPGDFHGTPRNFFPSTSYRVLKLHVPDILRQDHGITIVLCRKLVHVSRTECDPDLPG